MAGGCGNGSSARRIEQLMLKYQFKPVFPDCYGLYVSVPILIYNKYIYTIYMRGFGNFRACCRTKVKLFPSLALSTSLSLSFRLWNWDECALGLADFSLILVKGFRFFHFWFLLFDFWFICLSGANAWPDNLPFDKHLEANAYQSPSPSPSLRLGVRLCGNPPRRPFHIVHGESKWNSSLSLGFVGVFPSALIASMIRNFF